MKLLMKWLRASGRGQGRMRRPKRVQKEQWSKVSCEAGTARKLKMTKRKKSNSGKKGNQMEVQSAGDERLEEFWEQRRTERSSLQAELVQKGTRVIGA